MLVLDVNVVVAAHRGDHPLHAPVRAWFDRLTSGDEPFAVPAGVWSSFLRVTTNRRIFEVPTPLDEAFAFLEATVAQPNHLTAGPGPRHYDLLRSLCEEGAMTGDLVPDATIAAIASEHAATVVTLDRDFARLQSVRHRLLPT